MSIASEITRLQGAKNTLKTKLNGINKSTDQITTETLDNYGDFVDSISNNITTAATKLQTDLYNPSEYNLIAVGKGSNITLNNTEEASLEGLKILGKTEQEIIESNNLLNITSLSPSDSSVVTATWSNNQIGLSWSAGYDVWILHNDSQTINLNSSKTYTFAFKHSGSAIKIRNYNQQTQEVFSNTDNETTQYVLNISGVSSLRLDIRRVDSTGSCIISEIMLLEGQYTTETIPEYQGYPAPRPDNPKPIRNVLGKNTFDESQLLQATGWTKNSSGYYTGTVSNMYNKFSGGFSVPINFKANTRYTISYTGYVSVTNVNARIKVFYTDGSTTDIGDLYINKTTESTYSYTTASGKTIQKLAFNYSNGGTLYIKNIQVEEGTSKTDFQQFNCVKIIRTDGTSEEIYNFPLGNQPLMKGDYIDKLGIHHVKGQIVLNGSSSENWSMSNGSSSLSSPTYKYFTEGSSITTNIAKNNSSIYCDYFKQNKNIWSQDVIGINYEGTSTSQNIRIRTSQTSLANFKSWLQANPVIIEYELLTPTVTPFTSEQQTIYNEILQDGTYEVVTTYTTEGNLAPDIEINYHKNLQSKLEETLEDVLEILGVDENS